MKNIDGIVTLATYLVGLSAVFIGTACAVSVSCASIVTGGVMLGTVLIAQLGGRKE